MSLLRAGTAEVLRPRRAGFAQGPTGDDLTADAVVNVPGSHPEGDHMTENNPTPEEVVEVALSGNTGAVKTLTDIRFEKLEARFAALEKENAELRAANTELYAFANAKAQAPAPAAAQPVPAQPQPVAAQPVEDPAVQAKAEQDDADILARTLAALGYKKVDDGM